MEGISGLPNPHIYNYVSQKISPIKFLVILHKNS